MRLSFDRLWIWIAIALPAFVALLVPMPAVDLAYQVRAGNEMLASGALPAVDTWTFTVAGTPWLDQQWLAQLVLALGQRLGGWELLAVLRAALVALTTGLLVATAMARGASPRISTILALAAFAVAAPALALRPQLFGIVLFAALLWLVASRDRHPRWFLVAPLLLLLWANLHGSFVLGPAILGFAWLDDIARRRPARVSFAVLVAGTLATLVNPFLAGAWAYAAGIGANPAITAQVSEWQRTSPLRMPGALFYPSVVVVLALMVRGRSRVTWAEWLLAVGLIALGAWTERGVVWWALAVPYLAGGVLAAQAAAGETRRVLAPSAVNGVIAVLLGTAVIAALPWWRPADPLTGRAGLLSYAPSGLAADTVRLAPAGARILVPQTWASWFEWAAPDGRYFIDSRFELFPPAIWADYLAMQAPGGEAVMDRWGVELLVIQAGERVPQGWRVGASDADGSVLVRVGR